MRDPRPQVPCQATPGHLTLRNCEIIDTCFKLISSGVIVSLYANYSLSWDLAGSQTTISEGSSLTESPLPIHAKLSLFFCNQEGKGAEALACSQPPAKVTGAACPREH